MLQLREMAERWKVMTHPQRREHDKKKRIAGTNKIHSTKSFQKEYKRPNQFS